jgi:hypothetical protein
LTGVLPSVKVADRFRVCRRFVSDDRKIIGMSESNREEPIAVYQAKGDLHPNAENDR